MFDINHPIGNTSLLFARIDDVPVTLLKGHITQRMSESYAGVFTLTTQTPVDPQHFMGKKITFSMNMSDVSQWLNGVVTQVKLFPGDAAHLTIRVESPLSLLARRYRSRAFTDASFQSVIQAILSEAGWDRSSIHFKHLRDASHTYHEQHQTSDLAFFQRLLREEALSYYFTHDDGVATICIDNLTAASLEGDALSYPYHPTMSTQLDSLQINAFHHCTDMSDAAGSVEMTCNIPTLIPGVVFAMSHHPDADCNRYYRVIASTQTWDETGGSVRYVNKLTALPVTASIRPDAQPIHEAITHLSLATVKGEGTSPKLTEKGAYYVEHHDIPTSDTLHAPVQQAQPFVGNGYGMHFPLRDNTEVLMARLNGHPDKPVILGALYNDTHTNPVQGADPYQNVIKTAAGHALVMNDHPSRRHITLSTPQAENEFILDANTHDPAIHLSTTRGDFIVNAGSHATWEAQGNAALTAQAIHLQADAMFIQSNQAILCSAAQQLQMDAGTLDCRVANDLAIQVGAGFQQTIFGEADVVVQKDMKIKSNGSIALECGMGTMLLNAEAGDIKLQVGHSTFELAADGRVQLNANKITIRANVIRIGNTVSVNR